ncbi:hypothetical protein KY385_04040 [Candidatus Parcubacteria bacterium]|nr:hypothetical protein [Candidatus Parcubacteria bacterium]
MKKLDNKGFGIVEGLLILVIVGLIGGVGFYVWNSKQKVDLSPENIVFAADDSVVVPGDLLSFLQNDTKDDCNDYQGTNSLQGVSLVSIYQVVQEKYAKVAIGCSTNLDKGFPVIKSSDGWKLLSGAEYYVSYDDGELTGENTTLPRCSIIDKYQIPREFESNCLDDKGEERPELKSTDVKEVNYP